MIDSALMTAALWIFCGLFAIVPIWHLLRSASEGVLDMSTAVVIAFILISLGVLTAMSAGTPQVYSLLGAMFLFGIGAPWAGAEYSRRLHRQIDDGQIEKCLAALQRDSRNAGAYALLAEAYLKQRRYEEAVAHFETALAISPDPDRNPHHRIWTRHLAAAREEKASDDAKQAKRLRI